MPPREQPPGCVPEHGGLSVVTGTVPPVCGATQRLLGGVAVCSHSDRSESLDSSRAEPDRCCVHPIPLVGLAGLHAIVSSSVLPSPVRSGDCVFAATRAESIHGVAHASNAIRRKGTAFAVRISNPVRFSRIQKRVRVHRTASTTMRNSDATGGACGVFCVEWFRGTRRGRGASGRASNIDRTRHVSFFCVFRVVLGLLGTHRDRFDDCNATHACDPWTDAGNTGVSVSGRSRTARHEPVRFNELA